MAQHLRSPNSDSQQLAIPRQSDILETTIRLRPDRTGAILAFLSTPRQPIRSDRMANRLGSRESKLLARTYTVYVIELARTCAKRPGALAPLYVGQTAHTPEHRFAQHKEGGKLAASKPHKFGLRLRYDLMVGIRRFSTRKEAERAEAVVAKVLEKRGHRVFWG